MRARSRWVEHASRERSQVAAAEGGRWGGPKSDCFVECSSHLHRIRQSRWERVIGRRTSRKAALLRPSSCPRSQLSPHRSHRLLDVE